jgi:hypothetical protein
MSKADRLALCLMALMPILGCGDGDHRAFTSMDAWYRLPPLDLLNAEDVMHLDRRDFALVADGKQTEARALLENVSWKKLSPPEAENLLGKPLEGPAAGELVLLRAVILNERTPVFEVSWRDGAVVVHHGCLGRKALPMKRRALVARLPSVPKEVYAHCSMAE